MADYQLPYSGNQIKTAIGAALNPDQQATPNSDALITSGAVDAAASQLLTAINTKADASDLTALETVVDGKQDMLTFDNVPTANSANPVKSGGVFSSEEALKQMILASFPTDTISNQSVASFPDGADNIPVKSMTVAITPVQSGSGDPSPTNVRPISGWTGANIVVSPTLDAQDGTTYPVSWQTAAGTVYGGTLRDNGDGTWTLTATMAGAKIKDIPWEGDPTPSKLYFNVAKTGFVPAAKGGTTTTRFMCSCYPRAAGETNQAWWQTNNAFRLKDTAFSTLSDFINTETGRGNETVVWELATPQTYTLTADSVKTLLGDNNIFADTGDVLELVYRADVELYIAKKLAEV